MPKRFANLQSIGWLRVSPRALAGAFAAAVLVVETAEGNLVEDPCFERLVTPRLTLRRLAAMDAEAFAAYRDDPDVARYQSWELPYTLAEAMRLIDSQAAASPGARGRWFQFAVDLEASATLIGDCTLRCMRHEPHQAELGFSFAKAGQGRGYASEALAAILGYAFTTLSLRRVFACTDTRNEAAQRLLERLGFRREEQPDEAPWFRGEWPSEILYAQLRSEWLEAARAGLPAVAARRLRRGARGLAEPAPWLHDSLRPDGSPLDEAETNFPRRSLGRKTGEP